MELNVNVDTDSFVSTNTKSLSDFKLVSSQNIFDATIDALKFFDIPLHKMLYAMTDNCSTMIGKRSCCAHGILACEQKTFLFKFSYSSVGSVFA